MAAQDIDKSNKRLKGSDNSLTALRLSFERVRTLWAGKVGTWLAIDIEEWERDHTVLTEFGWSLVRWDAGEMVEEMGHWIVKENAKFHNGTWVADRRNVGVPAYSARANLTRCAQAIRFRDE